MGISSLMERGMEKGEEPLKYGKRQSNKNMKQGLKNTNLRKFITRCRCGDFITDGEGNGKKVRTSYNMGKGRAIFKIRNKG